MSLRSSLDVSGRRRSPATTSAFHLGRTPANKGMRYPADPVGCVNSIARPITGFQGSRRVRNSISAAVSIASCELATTHADLLKTAE